MKAEEAIELFAEKYVLPKRLPYCREDIDDIKKELISDLNSLISEHYYPKEFVEWVSNEKETLAGTYNYWLKNIKKENER